MGTQTKFVSFCVHASFIIFLLLPFVSSSEDQSNEINVKDNKTLLSHKLLFEITTHGLLLWASMGFFMPIGILSIRMANTVKCKTRLRILFQIHTISQMIAVVLATSGAIMSFKNFNNSFNNNHQRIGVALYGIIWLQLLTGFLRPNRGTKRRSVWFFAHWMLGTSIFLMGVFCIYSGLEAYHEKTSRKISIWTSLFTAEICFFGFFYLFQDKWIYIQNQGLILENHLTPTPTRDQKELAMESC